MNNTDFWAPLVRGVIAPAWAAWERSPYLRHYRELLRTQFDREDSIRARQWERTRQLVDYAYRTVPFWRDRLQSAGLLPDAIRNFADFRAIPVLTKSDLRSRQESLLSTQYAGKQLTRKKTSGSTGVSVEVLVDEAAQQRKRACTLRSDEWSGWRRGERVAAVWGNPEYLRRGWRGKLRNRLLERHRFLDTLKMDAATMRRFTESLRRCPPSLLFGHAHSLYLLAEFVRSEGGAGFRPRGIISSAMVLHQWQRAAIEDVFQCLVTNRYGCEEVGLIACECERHDGLHVNADGIYLEVVKPDGSEARTGEPGAIVITDLLNRAMPMIRYEVGDAAVLADRRCGCGRGLPLIERLEGRVADYVVTARGELISGISLTENFAMLIPGIVQLQIVQDEVSRFTFRIVRGPDFGPVSHERMRSVVAERFGADTNYDCEFVDRIPQEASGKYRFCISKVQNPFTAGEPVEP